MKQIGVERLHGILEPCGGVDHGLNGDPLLVKGRIRTRHMVLDQLRKTATEVAIGNCLERGKIGVYLVKPAAEPLAVLHDVTRDARREHDCGQQNDPIKDATYDAHRPIVLRAPPRGEIRRLRL